MRKYIFNIILLMTLLLSACGKDVTPAPTATATLEPTVEVSPTPTEDTTFKDLQAYLGDWSGEWRNTTFGSSGAVHATFSAEDDGTLSATVDLDGFVLGIGDPDPMTYIGKFDPTGAIFDISDDPLFGDLSITVTELGEISIVGESVPDARIDSVTATGTVSPEGIALEYNVAFSTGDSAVGEMTLTKDS